MPVQSPQTSEFSGFLSVDFYVSPAPWNRSWFSSYLLSYFRRIAAQPFPNFFIRLVLSHPHQTNRSFPVMLPDRPVLSVFIKLTNISQRGEERTKFSKIAAAG